MDYTQFNAKDPLANTGIEAGRELFKKLAVCCDGFARDAVLLAAGHLLLNVLRQGCANRLAAERAFDELAAGLKSVLLDQHYDLMGKRRNIYPYDQSITMPYFDDRKKRQ